MWVWEYDEEGAHDLYMDIGEGGPGLEVVDESQDTSPTDPAPAEATSSSEELPKKAAPYTLMVSCLMRPRGGGPLGGGAVPAVASWVDPAWGTQFLWARAAVVLAAVAAKAATLWGGRDSRGPCP